MTDVWDEYKHRLAGVWRATSLEFRASDAPDAPIVAKPHGDKPLGRAVISPTGYLSALLVPPERMTPLPSGLPWQTAPDADVAHVARAFSGYCGYLRLYRDEGTGEVWWETRVEVCSDPGRFGGLERQRVRFVRAEDGREVLELRPFRDLTTEKGEKTRGVITWEKFE